MCLEVLLAVPGAMNGANESPAAEFFEAHADIGPGDFEVGYDFVGREGRAGEIEERMNLCHRAVDPPLVAHLSPVEDELTHDRGNFHIFSNY